MTREEGVPLSTMTTLKVGGPAAHVVRARSLDEITEALAFARDNHLPYYLMGGGSNVLAPDHGYRGVVIIPELHDLAFLNQGDAVLAVADAGVPWDEFVRAAAARGLWGVENLAGIPGSVGGAPVQNIGAYGAELSDTLAFVDAMDPATGAVSRLPKDACALGYRDSHFKRNPGLVIVRVGCMLQNRAAPRLSYRDLALALTRGVSLTTPDAIGKEVRAIRQKKFPDLTKEGTAGSFFKNPTLSPEAFEALSARHPGLPGFPARDGIKISLAWLLDHELGLKGFAMGKARLFEAQPLVIATSAGATAREVELLADEVAARVHGATGISIEREVRSLAQK